MKHLRLASLSAVAAASVLVLAACAPPEKDKADTTTETGVKAAEATSADDFGGMDGLVEAAKEEGELNVIALPPDWANYGEIIKAFARQVRHQGQLRPARRRQPGRDQRRQPAEGHRPRARRLRPRPVRRAGEHRHVRAVQGRDLGRHPRRVQGRRTAPGSTTTAATCRSATTPRKVPDVTRVDDLLKPEYKGKVALNGDPTQAGAAFSGVMMASLANGGSADDIAPGVDFFGKLKEAGNFLPVDPTRRPSSPARPRSSSTGTTSNAAETKKRRRPGRSSCPPTPSVAGYYYQAINKDAPHPAAARLWQEFLYSDEGQNLWLKGGARPVRGRRDGQGRHDRQGAVRRAAAGRRHAGDPDRRADRDGHGSTSRTTGPRPSADADHRHGAGVGPAVRRRPVPAAAAVPRRSCSVFLIVPTVTVIVGALPGRRRLHARATSRALFTERSARRAVARACCSRRSPRCIGAVARRAAGLPRRRGTAATAWSAAAIIAVCGVLAQFGGVTLAFAFIATIGLTGVLTAGAARTARASTSSAPAGCTGCPG